MGRKDLEEIITKPSRRAAKTLVRKKHKRRMAKRAGIVYQETDPIRNAMIADNIKLCSNPWCCGNPRAYYGDPMSVVRKKMGLSTDPADWS